MDKSSNGYKLLKTLQEFCRRSFSYSLENEEITKMQQEAFKILELSKFVYDYHNDTTKPFKVTLKLHHITHYADEAKFYGPLGLFSALKFERKHLYFKKWSEVMGNYRNPAYSFAKRHQLALAVRLFQGNYTEIDYFYQPPDEQSIIITEKPASIVQLKSIDYPFPIQNTVARKLTNRRVKFWIVVEKFFRLTEENKTIFANGYIFELQQETFENFQMLKLKYNQPKWVNLNFLNPRVDFLVESPNFAGRKGLLKGVI